MSPVHHVVAMRLGSLHLPTSAPILALALAREGCFTTPYTNLVSLGTPPASCLRLHREALHPSCPYTNSVPIECIKHPAPYLDTVDASSQSTCVEVAIPSDKDSLPPRYCAEAGGVIWAGHGLFPKGGEGLEPRSTKSALSDQPNTDRAELFISTEFSNQHMFQRHIQNARTTLIYRVSLVQCFIQRGLVRRPYWTRSGSFRGDNYLGL